MYVPGTVLMWAAFAFGLISTVTFGLAIRDRQRWLSMARQAFVLMTITVVAASALLMYLIVTHDYRLSYVYAYSDNLLPMNYLISTFWAGQEGSFLLWVLCGALLGLPLIRFARHYESRVMVFYNLTMLALMVLLLKQNPFRFHDGLSAGAVPMDGNGLNPLLQNPWMVIHPPVMFVGYASLAIPFAFAMAALLMRRYDDWTRVSLPWVLVSVLSLGTAIMMGGYWAYETLGWGGYWGWDPVENASLVPWLATVALAHGMLLQRGRQRFRRLNLVLAIAAYLLVLYATFLTRSGILSDFSVHSFVDLGLSGWLIFIMAFFLVGSVGLLLWRWREIPSEVGDEPFLSRTIFFVLGILLIILIGLVVVLGTSAPLISRLWGEPSQVGPDFYNGLGLYLAIVFSAILGITPFLGWQRAREGAGKALAWVAVVTALFLALGIVLGVRHPLAIVYVASVLFSIVANSWALLRHARRAAWQSSGGAVAHIGMGLMLLAFITTGWFDGDAKVRLHQDQPQNVLGFTLTFRGVEKPTPAARDAMVVEVSDPRGRNFVLKPKMWVNQKSNQLVANPDIRTFLTRDLYIAPVEFKPAQESPVSGRMVLSKNEAASFRDWTLLFRGFDMDSQHAVSGAFTVGMEIELSRPGHDPVLLQPSVVSSADGVNAVSVDIPGEVGAKIRATGMNVDAGQVRVELLGLGGGIGRTAALTTGETLHYKEYSITFTDFDLSDFDPDQGKINFGAVFEVSRGDTTSEVVPFIHNGGEDQVSTPASIPASGGMTLSLGRVDAEAKTVELMVYDPYLEARDAPSASLVIDVSTKPLIVLVWVGTLLVIIGTLLAIIVRRRDVASMPVS